MNHRIRPGQLMTVLAVSAAAGLLQGRFSLPGILFGTVLLTILLWAALSLPARTRPIPKALRAVGAILLGGFFLLEAVLSAAGLGLFAAGTEQAPDTIPLLIPVLVLAAGYGAWLGLESHARTMGLWAAAGILLLAVAGGFVLPAVQYPRLWSHLLTGSDTAWADGFVFVAGFGGELALLGLLRPHTPGLRPRHGVWYALSVGLLAGGCAGLAAAVLGSWGAARGEPLYTAMLAVSPESAFRPDSLYTVVRIAAHYGRVGVFLLGFLRCMQVFPGKWVRPLAGIVAGVTVITGGLLLSVRPEAAALLENIRRVPLFLAGIGALLAIPAFPRQEHPV